MLHHHQDSSNLRHMLTALAMALLALLLALFPKVVESQPERAAAAATVQAVLVHGATV